MTNRLRPFLVPVLAVIAALVVAACGGDDETGENASSGSGGDVNALLRDTFTNKTKIASGKFGLDLSAVITGSKEAPGTLALKANGAWSGGGGDALPNVKVDVGIEGLPQTVNVGFTVAGEKAFVSFNGEHYALADEVFQEFKRSYEQSRKQSQQKGALGTLGIDPQKWLTNPKIAGDAKVGDDETTKITAGVDLPKFLDDINVLLDRARTLGGTGAAELPDKLTDEQKREIIEIVKDPKLELYTGKDDKVLRRLLLQARIDAPADEKSFETADAKFDLTMTDLNEEQQIAAPANAKPFSELAKQLGGLGIGGLGGGQSGSGSAGKPSQEELERQTERFERYQDCVKDAGSDAGKARECADLLTR